MNQTNKTVTHDEPLSHINEKTSMSQRLEALDIQIEELDTFIKAKENEKVWLPAQLENDGSIRNARIGKVICKGAEKGESNFKKSQRPAKFGHKEGTDLGTFVMNLHFKKEIAKPSKEDGKLYLSSDEDERILTYGRWIRKVKVDKATRNVVMAAKEARNALLLQRDRLTATIETA